MTVEYPVWTGEAWVTMPIPAMDGQAIVVPTVAAVVYSEDRRQVLLQRRDKAGEVVKGRIEVPGGRWAAGESAEEAVRREVTEETGITVVEVIDGAQRYDFAAGLSIEACRPAAVIAGLTGAYPALLVAFECVGRGAPRALPGQTAVPAWWPIEEVLDHLVADPDDFVWQTTAILREVLA